MTENVFITGANGGFGRLRTLSLLDAGHTVVASMRNTVGGPNGGSGGSHQPTSVRILLTSSSVGRQTLSWRSVSVRHRAAMAWPP